MSSLYVDLEQVGSLARFPSGVRWCPSWLGSGASPGPGGLWSPQGPCEVLLCTDLERNVELRAPGLGGASVDGLGTPWPLGGALGLRDLWDTEPRRCRGADASKSGSADWDSVQGREAFGMNRGSDVDL